MIKIKTKEEIELMKVAGSIVFDTHKYLEKYIKPGITTKELDELAYQYIIKRDATPSFKNYKGYPASICASVNDEVVHGIPNNRTLKEGDIISIDIGVCYKGYHGDSAWTYPVGNISDEKKYLLKHTEQSLYEGLEAIKEGAYVGDISNRIERYLKDKNLGIIKELVGHGIGKELHESPDIPNYGMAGTGPMLKSGMVLAVEPMITLGRPKIYILEDDWTIVTADGLSAAHFEHTVLVTETGYIILTKR